MTCLSDGERSLKVSSTDSTYMAWKLAYLAGTTLERPDLVV
jgi:hypothetical protein